MESALQQRLANRTANARSGRWDLRLADFELMSGREARVMVAYEGSMGCPKRSQMDEWVHASFNGNMRVVLETLRNYPDSEVVTAVVTRNQRLRPFEDSKGMLQTAATQFIDGEKVIWEVLSNRDGERYLSRATKDDLEQILAERQSRERTASVHHRLRLAELHTAGIHNLEPGDKVRFSYEGIMQQGEVSKVGKDNVTIKTSGKPVTVDVLAVVDVYEKSPKAQAQQDKELKEFFERAYGSKEFANKLVETGDK
jgi:preprotein translocase subunit YajC